MMKHMIVMLCLLLHSGATTVCATEDVNEQKKMHSRRIILENSLVPAVVLAVELMLLRSAFKIMKYNSIQQLIIKSDLGFPIGTGIGIGIGIGTYKTIRILEQAKHNIAIALDDLKESDQNNK